MTHFSILPAFLPSCMGEKRNAYRFLVGKPEGMRPVGRSRHKWGKKY
jgi:hypothetical protein